MDGITVHVLGDFGPFSRMGKSIGYKLQAGQSVFLIDCGAPLFQQIGGQGLKKVDALIVTHCHDDHKRWFSDLALFNKYSPDIQKKINLFTAEAVHDDLIEASTPALIKSLSKDSKTIIDIPYEDFVEYQMIGPKAKYRTVLKEDGKGKFGLYITDIQGNVLAPDNAKIIINQKTKKPRMLFKDPIYGEWVEPESFYSFSSSIFYEENKNIYSGGDGVTIEAIKAPVWHGVAGIGLKIKNGKETVIFSSDTAHDMELWKQLYSEKKLQRTNMSKREFESASIIYGDINDYIERTWSKERYQDATNAFDDAAVIHDISSRNSVVHTDYEKIKNTSLKKDRALLTHGPDRFTSEWVLCNAGKTFRAKGRKFFEIVGDKLYPMNADIYHKEQGKFYVGYKNERGKYTVYRKNGLLRFSSFDGTHPGRPLYKVDLYEDIAGRYFPRLEKSNAVYFERSDGNIELLQFNDHGSNGKIVKDLRLRLTKKKDKCRIGKNKRSNKRKL
jgi:ribonuclease BN (tRNA processing enzyme)